LNGTGEVAGAIALNNAGVLVFSVGKGNEDKWFPDPEVMAPA